jgi:hypothetical protein
MGASMNRSIVAMAALIALLIFVVGASDFKFDSNLLWVKDHDPSIDRPHAVEFNTPLKNISATKRANSLGFDENSTDPHLGLTCLQLQVIDEVDLLTGAECD